MVASSASAVIAVAPNGQRVSFLLKSGVNPTSIPGVAAAVRQAKPLSSNGNMDYNGGPVVHSMAPYIIYWDPSGTLTSTTKSLIARYFTDVAHDSGLATNVYGVLRQYTDSTGFANYQQTFSSSQVINDSQPYPTTGNCTVTSGSFPTCLTDAQLQAEIDRLISANGLPTDGTNSSQLPPNAPQYYVVLPPDVNECQSGTTCGSNAFCAYHGAYTNGPNVVLYAAMPTLLDSSDPKGCQDDGNTQVQKPNGDQVGDVFIKALSHEQSETISDPLLNAWWDTATGQEIGDNCNFTGSFDPGNGTNPNAFLPSLGGTASAGTLFNQSDNSNPYYVQSEWSNGDIDCEMRPSAGAVSAAFSGPAGSPTPQTLSFDPTASSSTNGYSSVTWNFGDGGTSFDNSGSPPSAVSHTYTAAGHYTVTLTLVDPMGNLSTISHPVAIGSPPTAAFRASSPVQGVPVAFNDVGSSDPNAGVALAFGWNFGDGSTGLGPTISHTFARAGTYTVSFAILDSAGFFSTLSHAVNVAKATITHTKVTHKTKKGANIVVTVNAPGKVSGGGKKKTAGRAGSVTLKIKLSKKQQSKLASNGKLTLRVKVKFTPKVGSPVTKKVTIRFKS